VLQAHTHTASFRGTHTLHTHTKHMNGNRHIRERAPACCEVKVELSEHMHRPVMCQSPQPLVCNVELNKQLAWTLQVFHWSVHDGCRLVL
jgi:hypothetical protein